MIYEIKTILICKTQWVKRLQYQPNKHLMLCYCAYWKMSAFMPEEWSKGSYIHNSPRCPTDPRLKAKVRTLITHNGPYWPTTSGKGLYIHNPPWFPIDPWLSANALLFTTHHKPLQAEAFSFIKHHGSWDANDAWQTFCYLFWGSALGPVAWSPTAGEFSMKQKLRTTFACTGVWIEATLV